MSSRFRSGARSLISKRGIHKPGASSRALARQRAQWQARTAVVRRAPIRGFVGRAGENKFFDVALANYNCDTTGTMTHLDIVTQGDTVNSRDGRKFMPTWVNFRGYIVNGATSVSTDSAVILLWDKQPNKALAAVTDFLDSASSLSQNKRENASRFLVIRRWDFAMTGKNDGTTTSGYVRNFDKFVRLPRGLIAECTPADTTGAIGNRVTGALLLCTVGRTAAGTTSAIFSAAIRVGFKDV